MFPSLPPTANAAYVDLISEYLCESIEFPQLKAITAAQWALESGWGASKLAAHYRNFGGMKWRPYMIDFAQPVDYIANDGLSAYCFFPDYGHFIRGYWHALDKNGAYEGWRDHVGTGDAFIAKIGPTWVGTNPLHQHQYVAQIMKLAQDHTIPLFGTV